MALRTAGRKVAVNETISTVSVNIIQITEDKLVNILTAHVGKIRKSSDWGGALAMFLSFVGLAVTSDFHETFGISADTLRGIFYCGMLASLVYLVKSCVNRYKNRDSVEDILKDIKNEK